MKLADVTKKMIWVMGLLLLITIAAGALFFRSPEALPFALGAVLGALSSVFKVISLDRMLARAQAEAQKGDWEPKKSTQIQPFLRFLLTGAVLALGFFVPFINPWGVIAGIFFLPIAAFSMKFTKTKD